MKRPALLLAAALFLAATPRAQDADEPVTAGSGGVPVPKRTRTVAPEYPAEAQAQGIRGIVILELVIDREGKVADVKVIRSIPGLDEAAVEAAEQWAYERTKVDGKPVSVRLTVPITFAMKLPEMDRQPGVPELRQGVNPPFPEETRHRVTVVAEVTLDADGRVAEAQVVEGEPPWANALLVALRTWRFAAEPPEVTVSFRVRAEFVPGERKDPPRVVLRLDGLRRSETVASLEPVEPVAAPPPAGPAPATPGAAEVPPAPAETAPPAAAEPSTPPAPSPAAPASGEEAPPAPAPAGPAPAPASGEPAPETSAPSSPPAADAPLEGPAPQATPTVPPAPAGAPEPPAAGSAPSAAAPAASPGTAPPPVEVITAPPPAAPHREPENGTSALRDVLLEPGVPDLARGRRPVPPPFARMAGASGTVEVEFSVGSGGTALVQRVSGPDLLKPAAEQAVASWQFRRTQAERLFLVAVFTYDGDRASAVVRPQATAPPAEPPAQTTQAPAPPSAP